MSTILIVLFLLIVVVLAASLALGRATYEVESARDTEFLELDGAWVRYDVIGGGPPVVLVHGWLSSSRVWEPLARRLAQRFTVYTLDLTGFGESDKPAAGYGVRNGSRLLYAFCAHFGLTRASVVGHDLGGNMAVKLAADHPDVVGRVVLVSAPADEDQIDLPTPLWLATLPLIGPLFYALGRAFRPVRRMWMRPFVADADDLTDDLVEDAGKSTPAAVAGTLGVSRREIARGRLVRQAKVIKMPMLVVSGEEDQIVDPHSVSAWAGSVQRAEICLMDACGHVPMVERPAEFAAQILAFLTGDARYLEQSAPPSDEHDPEDHDGQATPFPEGGDGLHSPDPYPAPDDTADLTLEYPIEDVAPEPSTEPTPEPSAEPSAEPTPEPTPEPGPGRRPEANGPPRIHRKRDGGYPAEARDGQGPAPEPSEDRPRDRNRRATSAEGPIPELPEDLFDWPEPRREHRRPRRPEGPEDDAPSSRNGPPQG